MAGMSVWKGLRDLVARLSWEWRRLWHALLMRIGVLGITAIGLVVVACAAWGVRALELRRLDELNTALANRYPAHVGVPPPQEDDGVRLTTFRDLLTPHEDIPVVVQDLLSRAERLGLRLPKAEYRSDAELLGTFVRYRMVMPVSGEATAVQRFISEGLGNHRSLAIESVQFKRESVLTSRVEARVLWSLLVRPPGLDSPTASGSR